MISSQQQVQLLANHVTQVGSAIVDLNRRIDSIASAQPSLPPPVETRPPPPAVDEAALHDRVLAKLTDENAKLRESVSQEARTAAARERASLEAMLTHRVEQLVTKLVKERVAQGIEDVKQELLAEQRRVAAPVPVVVDTVSALDDISLETKTDDIISVTTSAGTKRGGKNAKKAAATVVTTVG